MSTLTVNTISETTSGNGVTIDGVNIKDSQVPAAAGSSLVYLTTVSATNQTSIAIENNFNNTDYYSYTVEGFIIPVTDDRHILCYIGHGGSSTTWITSSYRTVSTKVYYGASNGTGTVTDSSNAFADTGIGANSTDAGVFITYTLTKPYEATRYKLNRYTSAAWEQNDHIKTQYGGSIWYGGSNAITAIKFQAYDYTGGGSHGNVTGELRLYGLKAS